MRPGRYLGLAMILLLGLPPLGLVLSGRRLAPCLAFPPDGSCLAHAPFSWLGFSVIATLALAALVCALLRECRNDYSYAHSVYTLSFIQRFEIFELPLPGYAGYLPFGIACAIVADLSEQPANAPLPR